MTDVFSHEPSRVPARSPAPKPDDRAQKVRDTVEGIRRQFLAPLAAWEELARNAGIPAHSPSAFLSPVLLRPDQPTTEAERVASLDAFARRFEGQPSVACLQAHREAMASVASAQPLPALNRMAVGLMVGSFPNARPHSPETYLETLISALDEAPLPPAAVAKACNTITATSTFPPSVAEVLTAAKYAQAELEAPARRIDRYQQVIEWAAEVRKWLETVPLLAADRSNRQRPPEPQDGLRYGPESAEWR